MAVVDPSALRVVVRSAQWAQSLRAERPTALVRPLCADLAGVVVSEGHGWLRIVTERDASKLGYAPEELFRRAERNTLQLLADEPGPTTPLPGEISMLDRGNRFEATRLLDAQEWAPVAKTVSGTLVVAAPEPRLVLYADTATEGALHLLRSMARRLLAATERPLSDSVLRWTARGWQRVPEFQFG